MKLQPVGKLGYGWKIPRVPNAVLAGRRNQPDTLDERLRHAGEATTQPKIIASSPGSEPSYWTSIIPALLINVTDETPRAPLSYVLASHRSEERPKLERAT
jgi:hypothetical protein